MLKTKISKTQWSQNIVKLYDFITKLVKEPTPFPEHASFQSRIGDLGEIHFAELDGYQSYDVKYLHQNANGKPSESEDGQDLVFMPIQLNWCRDCVSIYWDETLVHESHGISFNKFIRAIDNFGPYSYRIDYKGSEYVFDDGLYEVLCYQGHDQNNWFNV